MKIVGCFLEYNGKFAILLRHSHKPNGNTWGLPAGKVEAGEDEKTAILRELHEETGYVAAESQLEHLGDYEFGTDSTYSFGTYRVKLTDPFEIQTESAAHAKYRWVSAEECYALPNLIPDFHLLLQLIGFIPPKQRVAAKAVIEAGGGFLVLHPSAIDANRKWHIPGGIRDDVSEQLSMTAVREVLEETCIDLAGLEGKVLRIGEWTAVDKGEQVKILAVFFHFRLPSRPDITLSEEHDAFAWIDTTNHLDYEASPEVHEIVDMLRVDT